MREILAQIFPLVSGVLYSDNLCKEHFSIKTLYLFLSCPPPSRLLERRNPSKIRELNSPLSLFFSLNPNLGFVSGPECPIQSCKGLLFIFDWELTRCLSL